jgi:hypothetical protein
MTTWILALLMFAATDPITDEALRLEACGGISRDAGGRGSGKRVQARS